MELFLAIAIVLAGLLAAATEALAQWTLSSGQMLLALASVVLGQGLVRDLIVVASRRSLRADPAAIRQRAAAAEARGWPRLNLCLESTVGLVLLGLGTFGLLLPELTLPGGVWVTLAGGVALLGAHTKDWVLTLRSVEDHYDLPVWATAPTAIDSTEDRPPESPSAVGASTAPSEE